jgi:hypothetical protein
MQISLDTTRIFTIFSLSAIKPNSSRPQPTTCCSENKHLLNGLLLSIVMSFSVD